MSNNQEVKIYVRNSKKYGKILNLPSKIRTDELYRLAAESHKLQAEEVKLIVGGQPLPSDESQIELKEKAIVHLINLKDVNLETIEVNVRMLYARSGPVTIQTATNVTIRDFIDDKLYKAYGEKSDVLLLVHIGRQLNLARTFQEELIENGSELTVANIQELKNRKNAEPIREVQPSSEPIAVPIKDLEVPEQPKDIYPQPNFTIAVPQEVNAKVGMDLIFDSKIRHASSLQNVNLEPEEIIPEEAVTKISEEGQEDEGEKEGQKEEAPQEGEKENGEEVYQEPVGLEDAKPVVSSEAIAANEVEGDNVEQVESVETVEKQEDEAVSAPVQPETSVQPANGQEVEQEGNSQVKIQQDASADF